MGILQLTACEDPQPDPVGGQSRCRETDLLHVGGERSQVKSGFSLFHHHETDRSSDSQGLRPGKTGRILDHRPPITRLQQATATLQSLEQRPSLSIPHLEYLIGRIRHFLRIAPQVELWGKRSGEQASQTKRDQTPAPLHKGHSTFTAQRSVPPAGYTTSVHHQLGIALLLAATWLPSAAFAQQRFILHLDGQPDERIQPSEHHRWVHGKAEHQSGLGALKLSPDGKREMRLTVWNAPAANPEALRFHLWHGGKKTTKYWIWLEDGQAKGKAGSASFFVLCDPGWTVQEISLLDVPSRDATRKMDFAEGIRTLRIGRRPFGKTDQGFIVDGLQLLGERLPTDLLGSVRRLLAEKDPAVRNPALQDLWPLVPHEKKLQVVTRRIGKIKDPRTRRILLDGLSMMAPDADVAAFLDVVQRAREPLRRHYWRQLARSPNEAARQACELHFLNAKTSKKERVAILQGLQRHGLVPSAALDAVATEGTDWQVPTGLVRCLDLAGSKEAIDRLIQLLHNPQSQRVQQDIVESLKRWTGKDLGLNARAWRDWWDVNRDKEKSLSQGAARSTGYGSFYGIPISEGRITFVIDISGSMREPLTGRAIKDYIEGLSRLKDKEIKSRLDLAKEELVAVLEALPDNAAVQVIPYSDSAAGFARAPEKLSKAARKKFTRRVRSLGAGGGTNIHDGLMLAFFPGRKPQKSDWEQGPDTIFLLTDGAPSRGPIVHTPTLRDAALEWNVGRGICIHTINVGDRPFRWLEDLSEATGGVAIDLTSAQEK